VSRRCIAFAGAAAVALLTSIGRSAQAFPWSIDMFSGNAVAPMDQAPRVIPPGTLPMQGESPRSTAASRKLKNPVDPGPENLAQGRQLYSNYCAVCHGTKGRGDGSVASCCNGTQVMPSYGDALEPLERWRVVAFVRELQRSSPALASHDPARPHALDSHTFPEQ
jgi:cytochrome c1